MAEQLSMPIRTEYRKLDAMLWRAQQDFFNARGRYKTNGSARLQWIRNLHGEVDKTTQFAIKQYTASAPQLYADAARAVLPGFTMGDVERKQLQKLQLEGAQAVKGISDHTKRDVQRFINTDSNAYKVSADAKDAYIQKNGVKGARFTKGGNHVTGARQTVGNYADMVFRTNFARIQNAGTLAGARQGNFEVVRVHDGAACGWSFHRDPDKANGKLVTLEYAEQHPLAHPHCQRRFELEPNLDRKDAEKKNISTAAKAAIATAAVSTGLAVMGIAASTQQGRVQAFLRAAGVQSARYKMYETKLKQQKKQFERYDKFMAPADLYDFITGMPIVETPEQMAYYFAQVRGNIAKMSKMSPQDLASTISAYGEAFWQGQELPLFVRQFFDIPANASRKVVGDHFREFSEFEAMRFKYMNMGATQTLIEFIDLENRVRDAFYSWVGPRGPSFARFSFPKVGGQRYGRFTSVDPNGFTKTTRTAGKYGIINRMTFNHNGALRAGFVRDPRTGRITPNFRLIPKGPLRITTEVNRSPKTGRVNSVSAIIKLITKAPVNLEARLNISLRALNIYSADDILKLKWGDFRRMRMDPQFFTFVSNAAELRLRGPRLGFGRWTTTFDYAHIFRMKWEDTRSIFNLTTIYLREQLIQVRQWAVGGIGDVDWKIFGVTSNAMLPDDPVTRTVFAKDIINRILIALNFREDTSG